MTTRNSLTIIELQFIIIKKRVQNILLIEFFIFYFF
jgi:hypothetical protein